MRTVECALFYGGGFYRKRLRPGVMRIARRNSANPNDVVAPSERRRSGILFARGGPVRSNWAYLGIRRTFKNGAARAGPFAQEVLCERPGGGSAASIFGGFSRFGRPRFSNDALF